MKFPRPIKDRTRISLGIVLILTATILVVFRLIPQLGRIFHLESGWPVWIMLAGFGLLLIGLLSGRPNSAIPSCIILGLGGIFYYQKTTMDWASWSYMWTLIPGFVGVGINLSGIFSARFKQPFIAGSRLILISLIMFFSLASFLSKQTFWSLNRDIILAIVLLFLGVLLIARTISRFKIQEK